MTFHVTLLFFLQIFQDILAYRCAGSQIKFIDDDSNSSTHDYVRTWILLAIKVQYFNSKGLYGSIPCCRLLLDLINLLAIAIFCFSKANWIRLNFKLKGNQPKQTVTHQSYLRRYAFYMNWMRQWWVNATSSLSWWLYILLVSSETTHTFRALLNFNFRYSLFDCVSCFVRQLFWFLLERQIDAI